MIMVGLSFTCPVTFTLLFCNTLGINYNVWGTKTAPFFYYFLKLFFVSYKKTTDKICFKGLQDKSYPFMQNTAPEKVALAKKGHFLCNIILTQELYPNCFDQQ